MSHGNTTGARSRPQPAATSSLSRAAFVLASQMMPLQELRSAPDEAHGHRHRHGRHSLSLACIGLSLALGAFACGGDGLPWQAERAADARELEILMSVPVDRLTREEYAAEAAEQAETVSDDYFAYYANTYGRLGFFDTELDLRPVFTASRSDFVGATYSPEDQRITLVGDAPDSTFVHEWVHALQDQHFGLIAYDDLSTSDGFLARRAVVEGDAVLATYRFESLVRGRDLDAIDWRPTWEGWLGFSDEIVAEVEYPLIFVDYVTFVYPYGLSFSGHNLLGIRLGETGEESPPPPPYDWSLQDELFTTRPPQSTKAVLLLDVLGDELAPVNDIGLGQVPEELAETWMLWDWDRLGMWYVHLLLHPLELGGELADSLALARAWNGDRADFLRAPDSDEVAVVWATAWTSEAAATEFAAALSALHGFAAVPDPEGDPEAEDGPAGTAADGEAMWLEQRGERVVLVKNLPPGQASAAADGAFFGASLSTARRHGSLAAQLERLRSVRAGAVRCPFVDPALRVREGMDAARGL